MIRRTYPQAAMTRSTGPRQRYPLDTHDKNHTNKNSITLSNDPPGGDGDARSHSTARGTTGHHVVMLSVPLLFIVGIFSLASMRERDVYLHHSRHHESTTYYRHDAGNHRNGTASSSLWCRQMKLVLTGNLPSVLDRKDWVLSREERMQTRFQGQILHWCLVTAVTHGLVQSFRTFPCPFFSHKIKKLVQLYVVLSSISIGFNNAMKHHPFTMAFCSYPPSSSLLLDFWTCCC